MKIADAALHPAGPARRGKAMKRLFLVLAAAAVVLVGIVYVCGREPAGVLRDLERAGPVRTFEPRFSVGTEFHECNPPAKNVDGPVLRVQCGTMRDAPPWAVRLASDSELLHPDSLQGSALAGVLWWDEKDATLNEGIEKLAAALRLGGDSVPLLVDLSGMHLVRAQQAQSLLDVIVALNYAQSAMRLAPRNEAALYNAALAAELIPLDAVADRAWGAYLAVDSTSKWAGEAIEHRKRLVLVSDSIPKPGTSFTPEEANAYAKDYPQEAREGGWRHVLPAWGEAVLKGDQAGAAAQLRLARLLGAGLETGGGDLSLADAVLRIDAAAGNGAATRQLAEAHGAYGIGRDSLKTSPSTATDAFERVLALDPPSPVLLTAARIEWLATVDADRLLTEAEGLRPDIDSIRHPIFLARLRWISGLTRFKRGDIATAAGLLGAASDTYRRLREVTNLGQTVQMAALSRVETGDTLDAYRDVYDASQMLRSHRNSLALYNVLSDLARYAARNEQWAAALAIQEEAVVVAAEVPAEDAALPEALLSRAEFRAAAGDRDSIGSDLDSAQALIVRMDTSAAKGPSRQLGYARAVTGNGSISTLNAVVASFEGEHAGWWMLSLARRAELYLREKNHAGAVEDLNRITAHVLGLTVNNPSFHLRSAVIEQARRRFDELALLHVRGGRILQALQAVEAGRISFALGAGPRSVDDVRIDPPRGYVALEYALIGDTLLTWVIRHDSTFLRVRTTDRDALLLAINRARTALESPRRAHLAQPQLELLYDALIRPVATHIGRGAPLVILADGEIAGVPMVALRDSARGEYLLQHHLVRYASSLAAAATPPPARNSTALRALLVSNPRFDQQAFPDLDSLEGADAEVAALLQLYTGAERLGDEAATLDAFRERAPRVDVIHFAGHALFDDTRPEQSSLVLAGRGRLSAQMADSLDLGGVRLVVLSACRTARARQGRSGGMAGLSGALLSAGAGGVVGSLWDVSDELTQPLMVHFHREYSQSGNAAEALREAQLAMLRGDDESNKSPAAWAGFRYVGR
jgi:CHAT domain-containing protein